ncbi:hypothetical protein L5515_013288 [Caenorhabditis briggsae]|uniref:Uncharacterized protein n=1 Tax=Caenorhabditis briggsae TaxID=6238 RepID=A0AAE9EB40_CAEBR|nr:hypothetical protein L5515_013288 [Caenorhabditis briggsae]
MLLRSVDESQIHLMDLLTLAREKHRDLYSENDINLRQEVLHAELIKSVRRNCRTAPRRLQKRRAEDSGDLRCENSEIRRKIPEEPIEKKRKDNLMGPFSAEDFFSQSCSDRMIDFSALRPPNPSFETQRKTKIGTRTLNSNPDVFQRLSAVKKSKK